MMELGFDASPEAVAQHYGEVINGFVYDRSDLNTKIWLPHVAAFETVMKSDNDKKILAENVVEWIQDWVSV
ncbi:MAG TPA: hypothetical protein VHO69_06305 [Phototrophicaceae bacterium]|nr:hypothetical protein [Phototrophicaceae bacterium]